LDYGCVQGSVLGPILFNIYLSGLGELLERLHDAYTISYADDSYVMLSCNKNEIQDGLTKLAAVSSTHIDFLTRMGMSVNKSKTEFMIFGYIGPQINFSFGGENLTNKNSMKILGITFQSNMKWLSHAKNVAKKINSFTYALRVLRLHLNQRQHLLVINAHVISHLSYGMPIWAYNSCQADRKRLNTLLLKVIRLNCRDFSKILTNRELFEGTKIRSFESLRIIADTIMLHKLITMPTNTELTVRLLQQTTYNPRYPNRIIFCDFSTKRIGHQSFVNRAGQVADLIPFPWSDLNTINFKKMIKASTPLLVNTFWSHRDYSRSQETSTHFITLNAFTFVIFVINCLFMHPCARQ